MEKTKRVLSLMLVMVMLISTFGMVVFADETTADGTTTTSEAITTTSNTGSKKSAVFIDVDADAVYTKAVETLNRMGIINGYPDNTFKPDQNVTRAEFTAMLMRTLNYGSLGSTSAAELPFADVKDTDTSISWAIPNINTAYTMGIINGYEDNTFKPNNNVSYEEAVKMMVCALGYTFSTNSNPWYIQYITQANRLGITKVASTLGTIGAPASRACIAQLIYDSLEVKVVEANAFTDRTILTHYLGYRKNTGIISSDGITCLTSPDVSLNNDEVMIYARDLDTGVLEDRVYRTSDRNVKEALGCEIEFYYKDNTGDVVRDLAVYSVKTANELVLDARAVDERKSNDTRIEYYKDDNARGTTAVNLNSDNIVIYNGKLYGEDDRDSRFDSKMLPYIGSVTLLDSDKDGKYDIIKIKDYEVYYVTSKVSADYTIVDTTTRSGDSGRLKFNKDDIDETLFFVNKNGTEATFASISVGDILCIAESRDDNGGDVLTTVVIVDERVTGSVTEIDDVFMTIGNKEYEVSKAAPWRVGDEDIMPEPRIGDEATFCLDINGDIVAYDKSSSAASISYGYLMGVADRDTNKAREALVLTQAGKQTFINITDSTRVNGRDVGDIDDVLDELEDSALVTNNDKSAKNLYVQQLIKYTTRTVGGKLAFANIITADRADKGESEVDELGFYEAMDVLYDSNYKKLEEAEEDSKWVVVDDGETFIVGSAIIFCVPSNREDYDNYAKKNPFKDNGKPFFVETFDVSKGGAPKVIVCYGETATASIDVNSGTPVYVASGKVQSSVNESADAIMDKVEMYSSSTKKADEKWISDYSEFVPRMGDIFRAVNDKDGYLKPEDDNLIYRVGDRGDSEEWYQYFSTKNDPERSTYAVMLGTVVLLDDGAVGIAPVYLDEDDTDANLKDTIYIEISDFSDALVLSYDTSGKDLEIHDVSEEYKEVIKSLIPYGGRANPSKVFVHMSKGKVKTFCVLDGE